MVLADDFKCFHGSSLKMNTENLPPLPKIEGDVELTLSVYTHHSLDMSNDGPRHYDSDRLAELGEHVYLSTGLYPKCT